MTRSCMVQEGSPEKFLYEYCRIPEDQVDVVMTTATAWRVTPGGRPLIDRRRRSRVARNVVLVAEYLEKLDVPAGKLSQLNAQGHGVVTACDKPHQALPMSMTWAKTAEYDMGKTSGTRLLTKGNTTW